MWNTEVDMKMMRTIMILDLFLRVETMGSAIGLDVYETERT